jgi:hypothetical protein
MSSFREEILRHGCQCVKGICQPFLMLPEDHIIAPPKYFYLVGFEAKFLRQADGLAISRLEDASGSHSRSIHQRYIRVWLLP